MNEDTRKNLIDVLQAIVWQAATNHLPILIKEVRELLDS